MLAQNKAACHTLSKAFLEAIRRRIELVGIVHIFLMSLKICSVMLGSCSLPGLQRRFSLLDCGLIRPVGYEL